MGKYSEKVLREHAKRANLRFAKGFQKYLHEGWGFVLDENGKKITGYDLYTPQGFSVSSPYPSSACHDHSMTLDEVENYLEYVYRQCGLVW